jgi:cytolysin-activating lysine-acyltransferase
MFFKSNKSKPADNAGADPSPTPPPLPDAGPAQSNGAKPTSEPTAQFKKNATKSKRFQAAFGEVVALLMRSPQFKHLPLAALEELVVPPIAAGQFMVAEAQHKKTGLVAPAAAILWARVSDEIDKRLSGGEGKSLNLAPADWKSGDNVWLVMALGDQKVTKALMQRMQETVLKGRQFKSLTINAKPKGKANGAKVS